MINKYQTNTTAFVMNYGTHEKKYEVTTPLLQFIVIITPKLSLKC